MNFKEWGNSYAPRQWRVYRFDHLDESDRNPCLVQADVPFMCGAESEMAQNLFQSGALIGEVFLYDRELVAAGLNPLLGIFLSCLASDWRGHKTGSLVMQTCEVGQLIPKKITMIYAVEVKP